MNVRSETIKFLEENIDGNFIDIGFRDVFVGYDSKGKGIKSKNK